MKFGGFLTPARRLLSGRPAPFGAAAAIVVAILGSTVAVADITAASASPSPDPSAYAS
jgi:hypothetical protein